jgi:hypothetical protein
MLRSICNRIAVSSLNQLLKFPASTTHFNLPSPLPRLALQDIKEQRRTMSIDSVTEASHKTGSINPFQSISQDSIQEPFRVNSSSNLDQGRWQDIGESEE